MAGRFSKLKRIVGLFSVLSMLVTSVAACACSHHPVETSLTKSSCHSHSESSHNDRHAVTDHERQTMSGTGCSCAQASPRLVFKQDQKELQVKLPIVRSSLDDPQFVLVAHAPVVDNFVTRTFSQAFLGSSILGRAPPRPKFA